MFGCIGCRDIKKGILHRYYCAVMFCYESLFRRYDVDSSKGNISSSRQAGSDDDKT